MAKARKASKTQSKLMTILYGEPFTGKSTLALQLAYFKRPDGKPFRILYLDPESGSVDDYLPELEENGINLDNIYIVYTQSLGEVKQYISAVKNGEDLYELDDDGNETDEIVLDADGEPFRADAIVVDGVTILNLSVKQGLVQFSKKRNRVKADKDCLVGEARTVKIEGAGLELKDYQTINFKGQDLILDLMASGVHCVVTARETDEKVTKEIEGKRESVVTGRKIPDGFKGMDYNAKTVIRTYVDEDGIVCAEVVKDRTGVHKKGEILEDPTMLDYQDVIDKTKKYNNFVLKNDLTKSVGIEQDIYEKEILYESGEILIDTSATHEQKSSDDITAEKLQSEIKSVVKSLTPPEKNEMKQRLKDNKLPLNYSKVKNIKVLTKILEIIK